MWFGHRRPAPPPKAHTLEKKTTPNNDKKKKRIFMQPKPGKIKTKVACKLYLSWLVPVKRASTSVTIRTRSSALGQTKPPKKEKNKTDRENILFPCNPDLKICILHWYIYFFNVRQLTWRIWRTQHDHVNKITSLLEIAPQLPESNSHICCCLFPLLLLLLLQTHV